MGRRLLAFAFTLGFFGFAATIALAQDAADQKAWREMGELGDGFVVWESKRTGRWRIWYRNLDGSGLRQLTADERRRDHYSPHLSLDGSRMLYQSFPQSKNPYNKDHNYQVPMHLLDIQTGDDTIVLDNTRAYFEDRAAVWLNNDEFVYIGGDGHTYRHNLNNGESQRLTTESRNEGGQLINRTMTHAITGRPDFSPYDPASKTISQRQARGGCQPYFTQDGVWGYWMGGGGGPVNRINLQTGQTSRIMDKNDRRLPDDRSYIYFPMVSARGDLIAFGASPNQHDHHTADYDIFVAPTDPETLEIIGTPTRYTFDSSTDRFPDVFLRDLELGRHEGEAPLTVEFKPDGVSQQLDWKFGDGSDDRGRDAKHTYKEPGVFRVIAERDGKTWRGQVKVAPRQRPEIVRAALVTDREIVVRFSEPIDMDDMDAALESDVKVESAALRDDDTIVLTLREPLKRDDWLKIKDVKDRAQKQNKMESARIAVRPPEWPSNQNRAVFVWRAGDDAASGVEASRYPLENVGSAGRDWEDALRLNDGAVRADAVSESMLRAAKASNELTVEAVLSASHLNNAGPARIVTFSTDSATRNFTLGQQNDQLVFRLRTTESDPNGVRPEVGLFRIGANETVHVVVTYRPGEMVAYRNGEVALRTDRVQGDLSAWSAHHFLLGDEWSGDRDWDGTLQGVAVYARALSAEEAGRNADDFANLRRRRREENPMPWPTNRDQLVFLWETGDKPNLALDRNAKTVRAYPVRQRDQARLTGAYAMALAGGAYVVEGADKPLLDAAKRTHQLTVEAVVNPSHSKHTGPARIVTFSTDAGSRNFTLGQTGDQLVFRLRTPRTGANGTSPEVELCSVPDDRPTHIIVTYKPGLLVAYRNGERVLETDRVQGDFSNWSGQHLLFGDEWDGHRDWSGTLEGVALYARFMDPDEAQRNDRAYRRQLALRNSATEVDARARLVNRSNVPTLKEIDPYREALVVYEYEVVKALNEGSKPPKKIRVAHWAILDGKPLSVARWEVGEDVRLHLEPFEANPQLERFYISDTLEPNFDIPLYYAVSP